MYECYACHSLYPDSISWCDKCKAPILKPKLVGKITCPVCRKILKPNTSKCEYCGKRFDIKNLPSLPIPDFFNWDKEKTKYGLLRRLGYPEDNTIVFEQVLSKVAAEYRSSPKKASELLQYFTAYLWHRPVEEVLLPLIELAHLHLELENFESAVLIAIKVLPLTEKHDEDKYKAQLLKIIGISYFELGYYSLSKQFLSQAMNTLFHLNEQEEWFKLSTYYFMSSMKLNEPGEALFILTKEIEVASKNFLSPLNEELIPVLFYLFNQFYWSPYEDNEEIYPPKFVPTIKKMSVMLEKIILSTKDIKFIHFIDYDRVLAVMLKAGLYEEASNIHALLLKKVGDDYDEKAAFLLKWMGAQHFARLYEKEKETWLEVQKISDKVKEQTILSAIDVFLLRDLCEKHGAMLHSSQYVFPEEYTTIITNKPTIYQRQNIVGLEPVETTVGLDIVFSREELKNLILKIKQNSSQFSISKTIVKLSNIPARKAIKTTTPSHSIKFLENNEIILIISKTGNKILALQFVSATQRENQKTKKPSHYLLVGYLHKPRLKKRPSEILRNILSLFWSNTRFEKTEILTNKNINTTFIPLFQAKKKA